jgi:enoyl-CoA hydratase/carnithine racemase
MTYENYKLLKTTVDRGVATVVIDNPPINLFDMPMIEEMIRLGHELEADDDVRVVIFESADPDFFIAHVDITLIQQLPEAGPDKPTTLSFFHEMLEKFRTMPKVTIGKIEGRARGGGSELLLALDMRFAAHGAVLNQPEVAIGIIPGGGGSARLPRLVGRGRALEIVLGCEDITADVAERYGYINRALPPEELSPFVNRLARRIASFPAEAIALAKSAVDSGEAMTTPEALLEEEHCLNQALATQAARDGMEKFMELGGQTREVELELGENIGKLIS